MANKTKKGNKGEKHRFILELPLKVSPEQERILLVRLDAARQVYNACLGEALRRLALMRQSRLYQKARNFSKGKEKTSLFAQINKDFEFREYDLHRFATQFNHCWLGDHLDIGTIQKIATRAFNAVQQYAFGKRGRPRFKGKNQFDSVEGKSNASGIRWRQGAVFWLGLELPALLDPKDKHGVQAYGLERPIAFVRIVKRKIRAKNRFFVQLVLKGRPLIKKNNSIGTGTVGLDIGPSTIAAVSQNDAFLKAFCTQLNSIHRHIRILQRRLDRSRRATNPENYNDDGTVKNGIKWNYSKRYIKTRDQLNEMNRRLAAFRKTLQGNLVNEVLSLGKFINIEKLSYRAWQKVFGKSIGFRAPGMFVKILRYKAESAGGKLNEFPVSNALSQICHGCGKKKKKKLKTRWHRCSCGVSGQRDLYSAFLASCVVGDGLDIPQAQKAWASAEPLLLRAMSRLNETAKGEARLSSFGLSRRQSCWYAEGDAKVAEVKDVVLGSSSIGESLEEVASCRIARTPRL